MDRPAAAGVVEGELLDLSKEDIEQLHTALIDVSPDELKLMKAELHAPLYRQLIESSEERVITSPYPLRQTFKAVVSALRSRLYHGASSASQLMEDLPSGTVRGRRAYLEGTPSVARLLVGLPFVGPVLSSWIVDVEVRVREERGQVLVGFKIHTTLPQRVGESFIGREFEGIVADFERLLPTIALAPEAVHDPIVGPNLSPPEAFTGTLRDYSRCATLTELGQLRQGDFPLGRYLWPAENSTGATALFLGAPSEADGQPGEHLIFRNVCVTAPVGMGKTYSI
ncbi:MAG: hypothetical protein JOZ39_04640, partial [Chloroflexi bacterium]|nr:hypothetical protein [Chloroflexota bacterium]